MSSYFDENINRVSVCIRTHNEGLKMLFLDRDLRNIVVREYSTQENFSFDYFFPIPDKHAFVAAANERKGPKALGIPLKLLSFSFYSEKVNTLDMDFDLDSKTGIFYQKDRIFVFRGDTKQSSVFSIPESG